MEQIWTESLQPSAKVAPRSRPEAIKGTKAPSLPCFPVLTGSPADRVGLISGCCHGDGGLSDQGGRLPGAGLWWFSGGEQETWGSDLEVLRKRRPRVSLVNNNTNTRGFKQVEGVY